MLLFSCPRGLAGQTRPLKQDLSRDRFAGPETYQKFLRLAISSVVTRKFSFPDVDLIDIGKTEPPSFLLHLVQLIGGLLDLLVGDAARTIFLFD